MGVVGATRGRFELGLLEALRVFGVLRGQSGRLVLVLVFFLAPTLLIHASAMAPDQVKQVGAAAATGEQEENQQKAEEEAENGVCVAQQVPAAQPERRRLLLALSRSWRAQSGRLVDVLLAAVEVRRMVQLVQ